MRRPNEPQRTCVGCRQRDNKKQMLRISAIGDRLTLDEEARLPGRGAYLHRRNRCITQFAHSKAARLSSLRYKIGRDERLKLVELIHTRLASAGALE
jgi:uncharacterized protein